ncbi:hypothetical protein ACK8HX_03060 [Oryzobacter sp. R7]|uniref:hypothetical protein n=1 Tax=Oryzobacter faecalis TaxID=3388656 RepID=UPI00398CDD5C
MPPPEQPRRPERRVVLLGAVGVAGAAALTGCTGHGGGGSAATSAPTPSTPTGPTAEDLAAVREVLEARAAAVLSGDEGAFAATLAAASGAGHDRQLGALEAARALRVAHLVVSDVQLDRDPSALPGEPVLLATASFRYRVDDLDRGDRTASSSLRMTRTGDRWQVAAETPTGAGATMPWLALPAMAVRRGEHAVVAGTVDAQRLAAYAAVVDRAVPELDRDWSGTPSRVLVLAPGTPAEAGVLLGRDGAAPEVAATTEGPTDERGRATGDRVVLDPAAFDRLTPAGREVVLTHELVHVAVRATVPGRTAAWLSEGYADHVGYRRADVPVERLLAPLLAEVRAGRGPSDLPRLDALAPAAGSIEVPYLAAWQAVEVLVAEHGEAAVRRLVVEGSATGTDADTEAATDRALGSVLGTSRAALVRRWRAHLDALATG